MEKAVTEIGKATANTMARDLDAGRSVEERKDHLKAWREIYQDVRRQWAEAENSRPRGGRFGN